MLCHLHIVLHCFPIYPAPVAHPFSAGTRCHFLNFLTGPTSIPASSSSPISLLSGVAEGKFSAEIFSLTPS